VSDVAETVTARIGDHFVEHRIDIDRNDADARARHAGIERAVEEIAEHSRCAGQRRADHAGRFADVRQIEHDDIARARGLQGIHLRHRGVRCRGHLCLRIGRIDVEQIVGAGPQRIERLRIGMPAVAGQVVGDLRLAGKDRPEIGGRACAAPGVIGAATGRRRQGEAVMPGHVLDGDETGIGGEAFLRARHDRMDVAIVGQAVAEGDHVAERHVAGMRHGDAADGQSDGAGEFAGMKHGRTPGS
jgi:hypothetical protein